MINYFDGKKIRDEILEQLRGEVAEMENKPYLRVFWVGDNEVSGRYVELKKKVAEEIGVECKITRFPTSITEAELLSEIEKANIDPRVTGIMVQIPMPEHIDKIEIVKSIYPNKDVDGLRICGGFESNFIPPVIMAILEAIKLSKINLKKSRVVLAGQGFLVGRPLLRYIEEIASDIKIANHRTNNLMELTKNADLIISATGVGEIIKPKMIQDGVVLIDAGTSEIGGKLAGDIATSCYPKASYYTPTPGGIGPMTIAMLMKNLVNSI